MESNKTPPATYILDLNDDCLLNIFAYLSVIDLCSISRSCSRLKNIGWRRFRLKHKLSDFERDGMLTLRLFEAFGSELVKLEVDMRSFDLHQMDIGDAIFANCTALESLTLLYYDAPADPEKLMKMRSVFSNLKKLILKHVNINLCSESADDGGTMNLVNVFDECRSMYYLQVGHCLGFSDKFLFSSTFPNLEHFECKHSSSPIINDFLLRHRNLKTLSVVAVEHDNHDAVLKAIGECKQLERLRYDFGTVTKNYYDMDRRERPLQSVKSLTTLKKLTDLRIFTIKWCSKKLIKILPTFSSTLEVLDLDGVFSKLETFLPKLKNLRALRFRFVGSPDLYYESLPDIAVIAQLKHLTELHLEHVEVKNFDLVEIIKNLENLTKLVFYVNRHRDVFTQNTYDRLVDVVTDRSEPKNRILYLSCYHKYWSELEQSPAVNLVEYTPFRDFFIPLATIM